LNQQISENGLRVKETTAAVASSHQQGNLMASNPEPASFDEIRLFSY
jgi:hypothetical protein